MVRTTTSRTPTDRNRRKDFAAQALETALVLAEEKGWPAVRLHDIAARLGVPPNRILEYYRDCDAVADAWFHRGWQAMGGPKGRGFAALPAPQRIERCLLAWFDALAPHRLITVAMLRGKLHFSHPHHWVPMIFNLSRTIHWLREAAMLPATYGTRRATMEEAGLTWLFLATLRVWARDDTTGQERTRRFLRRRLEQADKLMVRLTEPARSPEQKRRQKTGKPQPP